MISAAAAAGPSSAAVADESGDAGGTGSTSEEDKERERVEVNVEPAVSKTAFRTLRLCNKCIYPLIKLSQKHKIMVISTVINYLHALLCDYVSLACYI